MKEIQLHVVKKLQRKIDKVMEETKLNSESTEKIKNLEVKIEELELQIKKILYTIGR